tara:strand:+ start:682 stop:1431 length:750 start_codon:yes stop_codon:yes gene_type:complete
MLSISELLKSLHDDCREIKIEGNEDFDFNKEDEAYLITAGEILSYGDRNLTQLMGKYDPIGFCEAILARRKELRYRRISDLDLLGFKGSEIRKDVNGSHVVVKSIIQYSLSRIFENSKSKSHQLFEEGFIHQNLKYLKTVKFFDGDKIFGAGQFARFMYFIERGKVQLFNRNNKEIKKLSKGESFGESALLMGQPREISAISEGKTILQAIDAETLGPEIDKGSPLVQLALLSVLKRLELMNKLRAADA